MKKTMRHIIPLILAVTMFAGLPAVPAIATDLPDSTPTVESFYAYRNVLETGDFLVIIYENTPYATTPTDYTYSEAFVWQWIHSSNTTEYGQASGYTYQDSGYGYNVISFYLDADDAPTWGEAYRFTLYGTPPAFSTIPSYTFTIGASDYSSLTDTDDVKLAVAETVITIAADLDIRWGRTAATSLISEEDVGVLLSIYGRTFFRGAIYGLQGLAPSVFDVIVDNIPTSYKSFDTAYVTDVAGQYAGTYLETAADAGNDLLAADYNLFGLLLVIGVCGVLIAANWTVAGGMSWRGLVDSSAVLVIGGRIALMGLGELALVAALSCLYVSAKLWRMI